MPSLCPWQTAQKIPLIAPPGLRSGVRAGNRFRGDCHWFRPGLCIYCLPMSRRELLELAGRVLRLPTAPYHERAVRQFVMDYCRALGLRVERDGAGNVIARYRCGQRGAPIVFVAHMDHPGFEMLGGNRAEFLGGAPKQMFAGAGVRVFGGKAVSRADIRRVLASDWPRRKLVKLDGRQKFRKGQFGMWELAGFCVRNGRLYAPAIDDVLGTVVVMATLAEVSRRKARANVWGVFTRAEEVGFQGALALARSGKIPRNALVISVEMSRARPWARIGHGPVVRVGDRTTVFDPLATQFLQDVAGQCREKSRMFRYQRCLMDGGSCEATVFAGFGYRVAGLCLALGNYHNIGKDLRPRPEYVSVDDLAQLVELAVAAAGHRWDFGKAAGKLRAQLLRISRQAPRRLRATL